MNKIFIKTIFNKSNKKTTSSRLSGFTLIEAMVAVFILTISIVSLMNVVASSLFAARYAKDEITVNYLLQEVIDYVRNDRDTIFLTNDSPVEGWNILSKKYELCHEEGNCYLDIVSGAGPQECQESKCTTLYYKEKPGDNEAFYTHNNKQEGVVQSKFEREIKVTNISADEIVVEVLVKWKNGTMQKERSLKTSFLRWQY